MSYKTEILQEFREAARKPILESKILTDTTSKETQKTKELNNILKEIKQQFLERIVPSSFTEALSISFGRVPLSAIFGVVMYEPRRVFS